MLLLQPTGNMLSFQLFIIIGANVAARATNTNLKLLPSTQTTFLEAKDKLSSINRISNSTSSNGFSNVKINDEAFVQFLKYISQEQSFTTIVILTNWQCEIKNSTIGTATATAASCTSTSQQNDYCVNLKYYVEYFQQHLENQQQQPAVIPVLLLQSQQSDYTLHKKFNSEFVMIICIPPSLTWSQQQVITKVMPNHLLHALSKNLLYLRKNRVILRLDIVSHEGVNLQVIENILKYCHGEQILNIIIISYQFPHNDTVYYSYEKFPKFEMKRYKWCPDDIGMGKKLFSNKLSNLQGYKIYTLPDQIEPRSMVYQDNKGQQKLGGYVAHFVQYFAKYLNATLLLPFEVQEGVPIFYTDILKYARNNTLDIPTSLSGPLNNTDWSEFSYPFEITNWCVMLPVEAEISMAEIYSAVLNPYFLVNLLLLFVSFTFLLLTVFKRVYSSSYRFYLADILINDKAFRAVLGMGFPFKHKKLDFLVVCIMILKDFCGFVVVTLYGVFLGSFMTSPPQYLPIRSFADLEKSGIKLAISQLDYDLIYPSDYLKYPELFYIIDSYTEFKRLRSALNTSNAYTLTSSLWPVYAAQQKLFSQQLFRYSNDLCFSRYFHLYFILPMHSVFRDAIHLVILKAYASGLYFYWFESSFHELVSMGRTSFADITQARQLKPLAVTDLQYVFLGLCVSLMLSVGIFVVELIMSHVKRFKSKK